MTCGHCGATVPEDADRCPKCLRRSRIVASDEPAKPAARPDPIRVIRKVAMVLVGIVLFVVVFLFILRLAVRHLFAL